MNGNIEQSTVFLTLPLAIDSRSSFPLYLLASMCNYIEPSLLFKGFGELEIQRISRESELPEKRKTPDPPGLEPRTLLVMNNSPADSFYKHFAIIILFDEGTTILIWQ